VCLLPTPKIEKKKGKNSPTEIFSLSPRWLSSRGFRAEHGKIISLNQIHCWPHEKTFFRSRCCLLSSSLEKIDGKMIRERWGKGKQLSALYRIHRSKENNKSN
jgi:hypothetical protein